MSEMIMQPSPNLLMPVPGTLVPPLHATRLISSIQGGIDVQLGFKTLVFGDNAKGKSMVTRALRLGLAASASNLGGRDLVSRAIDLLPLVGADEDLISKVYLSDGTEARFKVKNKKTGKKKSASVEEFYTPPTVDGDVFPLDSLKAALLGKPETVRKFILTKSGIQMTRQDVLGRLSLIDKDLCAAYEAVAARVATQIDRGDEVGYLLMIQAKEREAAAEAKKEANVKASVANESGQGLPPPPTEAQVNDARARLVAAATTLEQTVKSKTAIVAASSAVAVEQAVNLQEIESRLAAVRLTKQQAGEALPILQTQFTEIQKGLEAAQLALVQIDGQVDPMYATILKISKWNAKNSPTACACCGQQTPSTLFANRVQQLESYLDQLDLQVKASKEKASAAFNTIKERATPAKLTLDSCQKALSDATKSETMLTGILGSLQARAVPQASEVCATVPADMLAEENARRAVTEAQATLTGLEQARGAWDVANRMHGSASAGAKTADQHKALADACDTVVASVLLTAVESFEKRVQAFLPPTDRFGLQLIDGGREVCRMGLRKGNRLDVYLAGTEEVKLHIALAAALSSGPGKLAILTPDDRAWRPANLRKAMEAFSLTPQQVIIESPLMPEGGLPAGWTLVER